MISEDKKQIKVLVEAFDFKKGRDNAKLLLKFRKEINKLLRANHKLNPNMEMTRELGQKFDAVYLYAREPVEHLVPKFSSLMYITGLMVVIISCNSNLFETELSGQIKELHGTFGLATSALMHYRADDPLGDDVRFHLEDYMTLFQDEYIQRYEKILEDQRKR